MAVRSGALNLFRKNSMADQVADIQKVMQHGGVLSLSEVHRPDRLRAWAEKHGYGFVASKGDSAIIYDASRFDVQRHGSQVLNHTVGHNGSQRARHAAYALLVDKQTGKKFWQIAAHTVPKGGQWDDLAVKIRHEQYQSIADLAQRLNGHGHPVLLGGDLNFRDAHVKGFEHMLSGSGSGIMHVGAMGASAVGVHHISDGALNSDHGAVMGTYHLDGGGNDRVNTNMPNNNGGHGNGGNQHGNGGANNGPKGPGGHDGIDRQTMAANYGFALAFMNSSPELKHLFNQAVKQTWDTNKFIAKLRATDWFQKHSANVRNAIMQETSDPATYKAAVDQMFATVRDTWGSMFGHDSMNPKQLHAWAETAQRMGWSQAQLLDHMSNSINYQKMLKKATLGGKAAEVEGQLKQLTQNYGVDLGDKWHARQLERLLSGDDTITGVQERVKDLAMREYKAFADRIAGGETVMDIADPYMQKMASLLEMNPNDINLKNRLIQKALKQSTADGKPAAMDLHTFEDFVRKDPRWQYTDNAKQDMASVTAQIAQAFGTMA